MVLVCLSLRVRHPCPPDRSPRVLCPRFPEISSFQITCLVCFFFFSALAALSSGFTTGLCKVPSVGEGCGVPAPSTIDVVPVGAIGADSDSLASAGTDFFLRCFFSLASAV